MGDEKTIPYVVFNPVALVTNEAIKRQTPQEHIVSSSFGVYVIFQISR